ncbi:hypothetical protein WCX49_11800 [Sulfurimonas sp. HSL-1656]|uniref:hypothetical protein n=1 Tax=Thiomicrolovo subterrani TaxID=3131934 RepID=UPI0031F9C829
MAAEKTEQRKALEEEADTLGVEFSPNIGDAKLEERINAKKAELESTADGQDEPTDTAAGGDADAIGSDKSDNVATSGEGVPGTGTNGGGSDESNGGGHTSVPEVNVDEAVADEHGQGPSRKFTDVEPTHETANITEADLDKIMEEFEQRRGAEKNPISYDAYMGARSAINRVKQLIAEGSE